MSEEEEATKVIEYFGDEDVTVWLEEANDAAPVIFPLWPADFPKFVPVGMDFDGNMQVALTRRALLDARHPHVLWFCRIDIAELLGNTDAQASWFSQGG